jgi:hypothetical protein
LTKKPQGILLLFDGADELACLAGHPEIREALQAFSRQLAAGAQAAAMALLAGQSFAS